MLFVGSLADTACRDNLPEEYEQMNRLVPSGAIYMFPTGEHPAMLTSAEKFAEVAKEFLSG